MRSFPRVPFAPLAAIGLALGLASSGRADAVTPPALEMIRMGSDPTTPLLERFPVVVVIVSLTGGGLGLAMMAVGFLLRSGGRRRAASILVRIGYVLALLFGAAGLVIPYTMTVADAFPDDMRRATITFMLVLAGCGAYAALRLVAAPMPYAAPDCSRCGHAFATGQDHCPECGLAAGESTPVLAQPFMAILLGLASGLPIFAVLLRVTLALSGPRECVATVEASWFYGEASKEHRTLVADVRTMLEPSGLPVNRNFSPIIPRERFTAVVRPASTGEPGSPVPTMTIESSIENGVATPSREEFDAAVAVAADAFVRALAERTPASGPGSPTEAGFDQAEAKAVIGNLAAILRERLESGEASKPASPQPGAALPSINLLVTTLRSLAPPWWTLILPMVGGLVPPVLAWRSGRWGTGSPAERWIMPEARGWGRIG